MILLEFSMTPIGKGESVSKYVARSLDIIDRSGVPYRLTPMGTVLEGSFERCMAVVKKCLGRMSRDCPRVSITMRADCRKGGRGRLSSKIEKIEARLKRKLKT